MHAWTLKGLQRKIVDFYRLLGLLSIPVITIVTTISMANLFTAGQAANIDGISGTWAWLYAAAIETNVMRLFTEKRWSSRLLGLGLGLVAVAALQIESLQQTKILNWNDPTLHAWLPYILLLRNVLVYILVAYEGVRLSHTEEDETMKTNTTKELRDAIERNALLRDDLAAHCNELAALQEELQAARATIAELQTEIANMFVQPLELVAARDNIVALPARNYSDQEILQYIAEHPDMKGVEIAKELDIDPARYHA